MSSKRPPSVFSPADDEYRAARRRLSEREIKRISDHIDYIGDIIDAMTKDVMRRRTQQVKKRALAAIAKADRATGRR